MKRLPTKAEFKALLKLPHKLDEERKLLVFTASNGNQLFLTASGYRWGAYVYNVGNGGYYWSATPSGERIAWSLCFSSDEASMGYDIRDDGYSVRLVSDEPCAGYIDMGTGIYWAIENYHEGEKIYFTWDEAMVIPQKINRGKVECSYPNYNLLNLNQNSIACTHVTEEHLLNIPDSIPIDWEQRRYEIAKAALAGLCANAQLINRGFTSTAQLAVAYADALIAELQKGGNNENN